MRIKITSSERKSWANKPSYVVFALYMFDKPQVLIDAEGFPTGPSSIDELEYQVVDSRLSRHWVFSPRILPTKTSNGRVPILAFKDWAEDAGFFENLVEGRGTARAQWEDARLRLSLEFADEDAVAAVLVADGYWMCRACSTLLEFEGADELAQCTSCHLIQRRR